MSDSRAEFEASVLARNSDYDNPQVLIERNTSGDYATVRIQGEWQGWQASRAQPERKLTDAEIRELAHKHLNGTGDHCIINFARALLAAQPAAATVPDEVVQQFQEAFTKWEKDELDFGEHLALLVYEHLLKDKIPAAQAQDDGEKK